MFSNGKVGNGAYHIGGLYIGWAMLSSSITTFSTEFWIETAVPGTEVPGGDEYKSS